jgi:RND family efflux transporter MFP subunit
MKNLFYFTFILLVLQACQSPKSTEDTAMAKSPVDALPRVTVAKALRKDFALQVLANGKVLSGTQSQLQFRQGGIVERIYVANGMAVKAGQTLAELSHDQENIALHQAQQQLAEAQIEINDLLIQLRGKEGDTTSVSPKIWAYIKIRSGQNKALLALRQAQLQLSNTYLLAPYAGIIANLKAKPFSPNMGGEAFCTLLGQANKTVEFSILETELASVTLGRVVRISPVAMPLLVYTGQVSEINPVVSVQGLVQVKAQIKGASSQLFEGMNVHIEVLQMLRQQVVVPKAAVVERSGRKVVFTLEGNTAKWNYVSIAHENATEIAIAEGIVAGQSVIVSGNLNLGHDAKVAQSPAP